VPDDTTPQLGDGSDSPWAHDVPIPPPPSFPLSWPDTRPAVGFDPLGTPFDEPAVAATAIRSRRTLLVAAAIAVALITVTGVRLAGEMRGGGSDENDAAAAAPEATTDATIDASTAPANTRGPGDTPFDTVRPTDPTAVASDLLAPAPEWTTQTVTLDPRIAAMTVPTEVIALTADGTLRVLDVPTGAVHSIASAPGDSGAGIVVGDESIVTQIVDGSTLRYEVSAVGGPRIPVKVPGGVAQVSARSGSDQFLVMSNELGGRSLPAMFLVDGVGTATDISAGPFGGIETWRLRFLPATGEAIITDTGGTYVIDDAGGTRRISTGDLVALGSNHYVVRECDEALNCAYVRVDGRSGERASVQLGELAAYREFDSSVILSPDGRALTYIDWMNSGARRLVDLDTGSGSEIDLRNNDFYSSTWSADSSGLFSVDDGQLVFLDRQTGEAVPVAPNVDLGKIVAVGTRTPPTRQTG
jgi:hypothetical protein